MTRQFTFDYDPGELRGGRGCVDDLDVVLARRGLERPLVVTGTSVGSTPAVMDPVEAGLGDSSDVFAGTTPEKYLVTALEVAHRVRDDGFDSLVAVGSGSSLDVAKTAAALSSHTDPDAAARDALDTRSVPVADEGDPTPIVAVPTTLAGADLSVIGGISLSLEGDADPRPQNEIPSGSVGDRRLMPTALFYDLALFETTPRHVLCASAMNGFDKAVECLYSPHHTPVTDATAVHALTLMQSGFETLSREKMDDEQLYEAVSGVVLAQYGVSTPGTYRASVVHAFAHGFSHDYDVHQGAVHGLLVPHVLRYVFDVVDGRRDLLARAFGVADEDTTDEELAARVVDAVTAVRDDLGLPARLRNIDGLSRDDLASIARVVHTDRMLDAAPDGVDPTVTDIQRVLEAAW